MPTVVAAFAHPDDIELLCAGTLVLLVRAGWTLHCVTLSGGDCGASSGTRETTRALRLAEAAAAARLLGGTYAWAGLDDFGIVYDAGNLRRVTAALRAHPPEMVLTHSPDCYLLDHEETSKLVRTACFTAGVPLYEPAAPFSRKATPALYYSDALEGRDKLGRDVPADFWIDVTDVIETRQAALACHASQREWLLAHHGIDSHLATGRELATLHGSRCGAAYAEGFRQHLGHGYPRMNVLAEALATHVRLPRAER